MDEIRKKIGQIFRLSMYLNFESDYSVHLVVSKELVIINISIDKITNIIYKDSVIIFKDNTAGKQLQLKRIVNELVKLKENNT